MAIVKKQSIVIADNVSLCKQKFVHAASTRVGIVAQLLCTCGLACADHTVLQPHHNALECMTLNLKSIA